HRVGSVHHPVVGAGVLMRARDRQGGFTLMEVMISLLVLVVGLLGVMALQMTTVKGNRHSRQLERAVDLVEQVMEDLRGICMNESSTPPPSCFKDLTGTSCASGTCTNTSYYPDITSSDGIVYHRAVTVTDTTSATLKMVTATVTYADDEDNTITHTQTM